MPASLSPELIKQIQASISTPGGGYVDASGVRYQPLYDQGQGQDGVDGPVWGYASYDPNKIGIGDPFQQYNADGTFDQNRAFKGDDATKMFLMFLAAAGGMAAFAPGGFLAGSAAAPGAGAGFMGDATAAGYAGLDAASAATMGGGATLPSALGSLGTTAATTAATSPSWLTNLMGPGASLLGPAATLLGAAAGAKGNDQSSDVTKRTDPRFDPYIFGDQNTVGAMPAASGLLARSLSDKTMQGWDNMQNVAQGLLSQPVAGNGFNRFFPGR